MALMALKPEGGMLHVHANVASDEIESFKLAIVTRFQVSHNLHAMDHKSHAMDHSSHTVDHNSLALDHSSHATIHA